jgi:hypothetical protein
VAQQIAVYEPESAGLITTLGRLRFSLRVALTERDLTQLVREPSVSVAVVGVMENPKVADAMCRRLVAAAPGLIVVLARQEATDLEPGDDRTFLSWPLDEDEIVLNRLVALLEANDTGARMARPFPAVDWDSLDDITLSMPARSSSATAKASGASSAESKATLRDDPWDVVSTVVERPEGSGPSTALERPKGELDSFSDCLADITRTVWAVRALSETPAVRELDDEERAALAQHARTLGTLLHQISDFLKHPLPEDR